MGEDGGGGVGAAWRGCLPPPLRVATAVQQRPMGSVLVGGGGRVDEPTRGGGAGWAIRVGGGFVFLKCRWREAGGEEATKRGDDCNGPSPQKCQRRYQTYKSLRTSGLTEKYTGLVLSSRVSLYRKVGTHRQRTKRPVTTSGTAATARSAAAAAASGDGSGVQRAVAARQALVCNQAVTQFLGPGRPAPHPPPAPHSPSCPPATAPPSSPSKATCLPSPLPKRAVQGAGPQSLEQWCFPVRGRRSRPCGSVLATAPSAPAVSARQVPPEAATHPTPPRRRVCQWSEKRRRPTVARRPALDAAAPPPPPPSPSTGRSEERVHVHHF